jgi:hypothetical protein
MEIHFSITPRLAVVGGVCLLALIGLSFVLGMRVERLTSGDRAAQSGVHPASPLQPHSLPTAAPALPTAPAAPSLPAAPTQATTPAVPSVSPPTVAR